MKRELGAFVGGLGTVVATLWHFGIANIAELQSVLIPLAFTVAPRVPYLDAATLQKAAVSVTVVFIVFTAGKIAADAARRFN
ncbi:hypothetical protein [Halobaculum litoreum]|uniref:Uncharacterized protein n=1 Tax=Halobaculum litoreum TaxID=3031998 RepID=A0ABD5XPP9_9EURY|nr:hypothetical protein [Halobaculum sp. DT92]